MFSFSLDKYPEVELLGHMVVLFTFSRTLHKTSIFSTSLSTLLISSLFDNRHSDRCEVISHCDFDLHFPDD